MATTDRVRALAARHPAVRRAVNGARRVLAAGAALPGRPAGGADSAELDALRERLARAEAELSRYGGSWPPGHFHSPIPSLEAVRAREDEIFHRPVSLAGIDLFEERQLELVAALSAYQADQPFTEGPAEGRRYHFDNDFYAHGDGIVLHCMLRHLRPKRLIEIGSGYSSALVLDTAERFLANELRCTFIEPYPERLNRLLSGGAPADVDIVVRPVQEVDIAVFERLEAGDVLFVDSSHVGKIGSDVNRILFEILPALSPGVHIHFHDIFYPFEYERSWVYRGWAWNEAYLLRAFLQFNPCFQIRLFNSYLAHFHYDEVSAALPVWGKNPGGGIWLERCG